MKGKTILTGRIVLPGAPDYDQARMDYNSRFTKYPLVIVFCQCIEDVLNAVKWSRENDIPLRARSGRHSFEAFSLVDKGIIIDMSEMTKVHVDKEKGIAKVQTGIPLGDLYTELFRYGVTIPAGTAPDVGVAGLTLGGGIGFLHRIWGLTIDNLLEVEMVVTSGAQGAKVIKANDCINRDLFWALLGGGGGNFGIATTFVFKVHPIRNVSIYEIKWDWKDIETVFRTWQNWAPFTCRRLTTDITLGSKLNGTITSTGQLLGTKKELKDLLKPLLKAGTPTEVMLKTVPFNEAVKFFAEPDSLEFHKFKNTGAFAYCRLPSEGIETMIEFLRNAPNCHSDVWGQSLGGAVSDVAPSETAYYYRDAKYILEFATTWDTDQEELDNLSWVNDFRKALLPYMKGNYVNFPDLSIKDWECTYYGNNINRLMKIKRQYDPCNVFNFPLSIPLK
ncbi:FAD-binding oxidoreductase [Sporosarcina sp. FSL K6-1522]|uniref:FAD-dependent oxidoreductase n=1 Tax=Sporosarcina sp. FSL K6-1522 TaxID=2921554 RepID=UPI00315A58A1